MIIVGVEDIASLCDNSVHITSLLDLDKLVDVRELSAHDFTGSTLAALSDKRIGTSQELDSVLHPRSK